MLRNKVGELGGDAFIVNGSVTTLGSTYVHADAYDCGFNKKAAQKDKN